MSGIWNYSGMLAKEYMACMTAVTGLWLNVIYSVALGSPNNWWYIFGSQNVYLFFYNDYYNCIDYARSSSMVGSACDASWCKHDASQADHAIELHCVQSIQL